MDNNIIIGKNLIDMLMFSMYPDAKVFYREYVQNSYDAIVDATRKGILSAVKEGDISITINSTNRIISIQDNGNGISVDDAPRILLNIADSHKDGIGTAGQYGVGRLVGARYCKKLIFRTSTAGEDKYSEIIFDTVMARNIIHNQDDHSTATEVIDKITTINTGNEEVEKHYFEVIMEGVDTSYKELLNVDAIKAYLEEIAPIDYKTEFKNQLYKTSLPSEYISLDSNIQNVRISINDDSDIRRRYGLRIEGTNDNIDSLWFFKIEDDDYGLLGWGWFAITKFSIASPASDPNRGLRMRKQNIQIGDAKVLNKFFKQPTGNNYFYGEIHATHDNLRPTSARDGLAPTPEAIAFHEHIKEYFIDLGALYQRASEIKNSYKDIQAAKLEEDKVVAQNKEIKQLDKLSKIEEKAKQENNHPLIKIIDIYKRENVDTNTNTTTEQPQKPSTTPTKPKNEETPPDATSPTTEQPQKPSTPTTATDMFEPLRGKFSDENLMLIRKVCAEFSRNSTPKERPIIENIKNKVIRALSK